jgi:hypothetical protein
MAKMKSGVRSPTAHRTKEQAKRHGKQKKDGGAQTKTTIKRRSQNNAARAKVIKSKGAGAVAGKDVGHKNPLSKGGSNASSNLAIQSKAKNRGHGRTRGKKPNKGK